MTPTLAATRPADSAPPQVREILERGQRLEFAGVPRRALYEYRGAVELATTPALRAEAVLRVGDGHRASGEWTEASAAYTESLAIARDAALPDLAAEALNALGIVALLRGEADEATRVFHEALGYGPGHRVRGLLVQNLGMCAARRGDHATAMAMFHESLASFRAAGYRRGELIALNNVAAATIEAGDAEAALPHLRAAATIARDLMDLDLLLLTVRNKAEVCAKLGRLQEAERHIGEAIGHFSTFGNERRRAECLVVLGDIHRAHGTADHDAVAARSYAFAVALAASVGASEVGARAQAALDAVSAPRSDVRPAASAGPAAAAAAGRRRRSSRLH